MSVQTSPSSKGADSRLLLSRYAGNRKKSRLVELVRKGSRSATQTLYDEVRRYATPYLRWRLGEVATAELEDRLHDAFLAAYEAIRAGAIRNPERLHSFISTIVRHQATMALRGFAKKRQHCDISDYTQLEHEVPGQDQMLMAAERSELLSELLGELKPMDREILIRFYLRGQSREAICKEMGLTSTQFRLRKSRAKGRLRNLMSARVVLSPRTRREM